MARAVTVVVVDSTCSPPSDRLTAAAQLAADRRPDMSSGASRPGSDVAASPARVTLVALRDTPLSVDECMAAVRLPEVGAIALFVGTVRNNDHGRDVTDLAYHAHPRAEAEIARVVAEVAATEPVRAVAAVHRTGRLSI